MARSVRTYACEDCGTVTVRRRDSWQRLICVDCSVSETIRAAREMTERNGELYDRWRNSKGPRGRPRTTHEE